jgi:hypothetical protein
MADNAVDIEPNHEAETNAKDWPAWPMRKDSGDEHKGMAWPRPPQQPETVEVLHSNERPNLTAVFGTTSPPQGLSGIVRRFAFRYSENKQMHWIALIVADRINMIEGVGADLMKGRVPNLFAEMGLGSDLKYNKKGLALKAGAVVLTGVAVYALLSRPRRKRLFAR